MANRTKTQLLEEISLLQKEVAQLLEDAQDILNENYELQEEFNHLKGEYRILNLLHECLLDEYHLIKRENSELNLRIFQLENNHKWEGSRNERNNNG